MDAQKFGEFIQSRRKELGLTQAELAERLNVTAKAVSRWERGVGFPDINLLEPLANMLELTLVELMQSKKAEKETLSTESVESIVIDTLDVAHKKNTEEKLKQKMYAVAVIASGLSTNSMSRLFYDDDTVWWVNVIFCMIWPVIGTVWILNLRKKTEGYKQLSDNEKTKLNVEAVLALLILVVLLLLLTAFKHT